MQPIIGRIEQLTTTPSPPTGGSGVPNKVFTPSALDMSKLDEAQQKADKLKATLLEIQELIRELTMQRRLDMVLISQDGYKAIDLDKVAFYYIPKNKENDSDGVKYSLYAKSPTLNGDFYDLIRLFRHKNLDLVKNVVRFLANGNFLIPHDDENKNVLVVDLPDLYKHGMKRKEFAP